MQFIEAITFRLLSTIKDWKLLFSLVAYAIAVIFWVMGSSPGNMSPDSLESFRQLYQGDYNNFHPLSYTFLIGASTFWGKVPIGIIVFQSALMAITIYLLINRVFANVRKSSTLNVCTAIYITPFVGNFATTVWKDVPYACFTIIGLVLLSTDFSASMGWKLLLKPGWILGTIIFALGSTFRHEGFISGILFITIAIFLSPFFLEKRLTATTIFTSSCSIVSMLLLSLIFQSMLVTLTGAKPAPADNSLSSFIQDIAYAKEMNPSQIPSDVSPILSSIVSGESAKAASNCTSGSLLFEKPGFDANALRDNASLIPKLWLKTLFSGAGESLLKARYCKAQTFIPFPFATPPSTYVWGYFGIDPNPYGLENSIKEGAFYNLRQEMRNILVSWLNTWNSIGRGIAWPGLHAGFVIWVLVFFRQKLRIDSSLALLLMSLVLARTLLLIFASNGPWYRLGLPIHIISLSIWSLILFRCLQFLRQEFNKL